LDVVEHARENHEPEGCVAERSPLIERAGLHGGLVISLDFELAWGVHDSRGSEGPYRQNLLGTREVVSRLVDLFVGFGIRATWATVGFLFAGSREELERYSPELKPGYLNPTRDPYRIKVGRDEKEDPLHYGASLIERIGTASGQEIASHTFSHYNCLEEGQTISEFAADLAAAQAIARAHGHSLKTLVLPRHQNRADYLPAVAAAGFTTYRSNEPNRLNRPVTPGSGGLLVRGARLIDSYVSLTGSNLVPWAATLPDSHGLVDVRESRFLRPMDLKLVSLEGLRFNRLANAMRQAARTGALFHLWWHPHNFGANPKENLEQLRRLLKLREELWLEHGFGTFSMADVDRLARQTLSADGSSARAEVRVPETRQPTPLTTGSGDAKASS